MRHNRQPEFVLLSSPDWTDYELRDSGAGKKLERFGPYHFVRPEPQAIWQPNLPRREWDKAEAAFRTDADADGGRWFFHKPIDERWIMRYKGINFWVQPTPFRHLGVFPEQANHWDWMHTLIQAEQRPVKVLNLFGYTGLASLIAAHAGASVTHVDASKKGIAWARENQSLSKLDAAPIRWILDDALKFVRREVRRGAQYDGIVVDPPPFGRGPKGEIWRLEESLPELLGECRKLLSPSPLFVVLTAYAIKISALGIYYALDDMLQGYGGEMVGGEMVTVEQSGGRYLSTAVFARWSASKTDGV
ncbi:MAG: class I SAM-dependent methyltransferase [Chloroflexi bacterium]|nr:class I SAM-dependent methyltransferase [Chloroflexota bacterium]